jgi:hypothetical protein
MSTGGCTLVSGEFFDDKRYLPGALINRLVIRNGRATGYLPLRVLV